MICAPVIMCISCVRDILQPHNHTSFEKPSETTKTCAPLVFDFCLAAIASSQSRLEDPTMSLTSVAWENLQLRGEKCHWRTTGG